MISNEQVARIRHLFHAEHWKIGTLAAEFGFHPGEFRRALETDRFSSNPKRSRRCLTAPYLDFLCHTLQEHPRLRATRLFEMIRSRGYQGSVAQLRRVVAEIRPPSREAFLRLAIFPGEQAQADWAHFGEVTIGHARRRLSGFVLTLSYSRALWLEFFLDQPLENFLLYERNSIVLTTNKAFKEWNTVFPNATCIAALLDRLTHHAEVTLIEGDSYRQRESELETAARKKGKHEGKSHAD